MDRLKPVVAEAKTLGYRALEAEALARAADSYVFLGKNTDGERSAEDALRASVASRHDDLLPGITAELIWAAGFQGRFDDAERWMQFADAAVVRGGYSNSLIYSWILNNMGAVYYLDGQFGRAREYMQRARDIKGKLLGADDPDVARTMGNIALAQYKLGRSDEALALTDQSLRIIRRTLGDSHPLVASELSNRGEILISLGRLPDALVAYQKAGEIWEREFGADSTQVAYALTGSGIVLTGLGRSREAVPQLDRALTIRRRSDPDDERLAETEFALASALSNGGSEAVRALELARSAAAHYRKVPTTEKKQLRVSVWLSRHSARADVR